MNSLTLRPARLAALLIGMAASGAAFAHLTTGNLSGHAPPGDSVTIRNIATDHTLESIAAQNGRFHFRRLPLGIYEVTIRHADGSVEPVILARARLGETVQVN